MNPSEGDRRSVGDEAGGAMIALLLVCGFLAVAVGGFLTMMLLAISSASADDGDKSSSPTAVAIADIPPELLAVYHQAARDTCDMPWGVLAAVGSIESDHNRSELPGVHSGSNFAGAQGPMQFMPPTWAAYGVDGNRDGLTNVYDPVDAIWGAANYLCASGAADPARLRDAIWAYNHDWTYVDDVLRLADDYATAPVGVIASGDAAAVLNNPNLALCPACRQDLIDGVIDQRVINFLAWAGQRHQVAVSVFKTGHSQFVHGTDRVSNHWEGRAADLYAIDGEDVAPSCGPCRAFAGEVVGLGDGRPTEMGVPWEDMVGAGGWNVFSDGDHQDHVHVGWGAA
jgi:hypothetical protein